ncbi:hypothetical protein P691DRAFT_790192 [Macrolepiota fuliginosa MF-IS2]|uniref:Uncharacterized protein n=1 Tax=Macrolepiota fuliginosa MF-IS2 TaxID=1400762 RepID=A0A9P5X107_9AGAR|nr:hypothetical protein P691DRAFT_790192 [Macrolepiota fuliginosa MF-IS2]
MQFKIFFSFALLCASQAVALVPQARAPEAKDIAAPRCTDDKVRASNFSNVDVPGGAGYHCCGFSVAFMKLYLSEMMYKLAELPVNCSPDVNHLSYRLVVAVTETPKRYTSILTAGAVGHRQVRLHRNMSQNHPDLGVLPSSGS